jgi:thiol-disulfide isomerase/thioredoxin
MSQDTNRQSDSGGSKALVIIVLCVALGLGALALLAAVAVIGMAFYLASNSGGPQAVNVPPQAAPAFAPQFEPGPSIGEKAPDIVGEDIDGNPLKLSDFEGKVVLIDFWGDWCVHCRNLIPHARDLNKEMEGKPFVLLGVNSDRNREAVKEVVKRDGITWKSWWNGGTPAGPIATQYGVTGWPTLFLIDDKGIVRQKWVGAPNPKELDKAVQELVAKVGT